MKTQTLLIVSELFVAESKTIFPDFVTCSTRLLPPKNASVPECYKFFKGFDETIIITLPEELPLEQTIKKLAINAAFAGEIIASTCDSFDNFGCHLLEPSNAKNFRVLLKPKEFVETVESWPALKPENHITAKPEFPINTLPKVAADFIQIVSDSTATPLDFSGVGVLGAMATALGASCRLEIKSGWHEYPGIWIAIAARPGSAKSPALAACFKPIFSIQKDLNQKFRQAMNFYQEAKERAKKDPSSEIPNKPNPEFIVLGDSTQESLIKTLSENPRGGGIFSDELLGWLGCHGKYQSGGGNDREAFLQIWSNSPVSHHRKHDGNIFADRPVLTIIGNVTPSGLPKLAGNSVDGFLNRFLITNPNERTSKFSRTGISEGAQLTYLKFIRKLWELEPDCKDAFATLPKTVYLSEAALDILEAFHNEIQEELASDTVPEIFRGSFSKGPSQLARLALILHAGKFVSGEIDDFFRLDENTMAAAVELVQYFFKQILALETDFHAGASRAETIRSKILSWLKNRSSNPKFKGLPASWHDIRHDCRRSLTLANGKIDDYALEQALDGLQATGHIRLEYPQNNQGKQLRPLVYVNPALSQISQ
jgi:hypothetical protein